MPKNEHMCPKDVFVSNRNISNIFEEASPPRDKLDFGEPQASGILSPSGRHTHSEQSCFVSYKIVQILKP